MPQSIIIAEPTTLFRVGRLTDSQGLWYDEKGNYHGDVHKLKDGPAAALPMGVDPIFRSEEKAWISTTHSLETLRNWFTLADMRELVPQGYVLEAIDVTEFRRFVFETYEHEAYSTAHMLERRVLDPRELYSDLLALDHHGSGRE